MAGLAIRVLVAEDYEPLRRFVSATIEKLPQLQIIGEASDGLAALQKAQELQAEMILLDINLPKLNGFEVARRIRDHSPQLKIIFLSMDRCFWFALHDGERETWRLAELLGTLRSDREFLRDYDARLDTRLTENRMAVRDENGCLVEPPDPIEAARALPVYHEIVREIEAEFADRAVSVLQRAGLHAWRNPVGHIAVGA